MEHMEKNNVLHRESITIDCLCQTPDPLKYSWNSWERAAGNELWCTLVAPQWEELCTALCGAAGAGKGRWKRTELYSKALCVCVCEVEQSRHPVTGNLELSSNASLKERDTGHRWP